MLSIRYRRTLGLASVLILMAGCWSRPGLVPLVVSEQRAFDIREPAAIPHPPLPMSPEPATVRNPAPKSTPQELSLDDAIRIALGNAQVVRTLAGVSVATTGQTIYDPAIRNTDIDIAKSVFDPVVTATNAFTNSESPFANFDPLDPRGAIIGGSRVDNYDLGLGISKKLVTGGTLRADGALNAARFVPGPAPLNPQERSAITLSLNQPLLQGAGVAANIAPIVIARINTERSYFQLKDNVQELVRGVIEAYWAVVFARTDAWARKIQVEQGEAARNLAEGRRKAGLGTAGDVAQANVALSNFKASLVGAEANLLQREAALRNLLYLPPTVPERFVPITPPTPELYNPKWEELIRLAQEMRPDLIELSLILEADQQNIIQANNQALPKVDATMLYRWNGLDGTAPSGARVSSGAGQFTDWSMGVNFSVPLCLRQGRANLRKAELILISDRANLEQGRHNAVHILAGNVRNLAQYYEQYKAFLETRTAARINLEQQIAVFRSGRGIFLNVLQAITDWGNAVSSEAQALAQYNAELASLERQTGTILESHGIRFLEEQFKSIGPFGRLAHEVAYPLDMQPGPNGPRYPNSDGPAEKMLEQSRPRLDGISPAQNTPPQRMLPMPPAVPNELPPAAPQAAPAQGQPMSRRQ